VALGTAAAMPNAKADPGTLNPTNTANISGNLTDRQANANRADRSLDRNTAAPSTVDQVAPDLWLLPLKNYTISSPFGERWGTLHPGVDLAVSEGTPYYAAHSGTVKLARWYGGYGYCVMIDAGNGVTIVYGHSSKLLVSEGQQVQAGDLIALTGDTGYSFGPHLHFEIRQNDAPIDPVPFMQSHGVDIQNKTQAIDS
jgi:murein DD-endopeptidase MepM/ murein hydrolase activator NlpD